MDVYVSLTGRKDLSGEVYRHYDSVSIILDAGRIGAVEAVSLSIKPTV
jgi:hypothetical protein